MKKNQPKKAMTDTKPKAPEKPHKDTKTHAKDSKVPAKEIKKQQEHKQDHPKVNVPVIAKEKPMDSMDMPLGGLAAVLESEDKRCLYMIDEGGNSYTFFKYKGRLIDLPSLHMDIHIKSKPRQAVMQEIRKQLLYGIKQGQAVVIHVGLNELNLEEFFKDEPFWDPKQLFRSPDTFDTEWYRSKIMKPADKDIFGNEGSFFPSKEFRIFVSLSKDIPFDEVKWLQVSKKEFRRIKII